MMYTAGMIRTMTWLIGTVLIAHDAVAGKHADDSHYTPVGFFDMHVCNWPDRPPFYLALFSTTQFDAIRAVHVITPDGSKLFDLDLNRYRTIKRKGKPEKRVFMLHVPIPDGAIDGWYQAQVVMKSGEQIQAKDYVEHRMLDRAVGHQPAHQAVLATPPKQLSWQKIEGAGFYQVFVRDLWNDSKLIHSSKLMKTTHYALPEGLLQRGGYYAWKVHARDVNEDIRLGDFNLGSQSEWVEFSID